VPVWDAVDEREGVLDCELVPVALAVLVRDGDAVSDWLGVDRAELLCDSLGDCV
jgi:hypothetical protein